MNNFMIETKDLTKRFSHETAVDAVNLQVRANTIYGLLGPNGAGKSTILKMLTGIIKPTSGQILMQGEKWSKNHLDTIGALIENAPIYPNLTARENLQIYTLQYRLPIARIDEVLQIVDLADTKQKLAGSFSLGMKQRLGIAIALIRSPKLLILDEPTNGLDPIGIHTLRDMIKSFPSHVITVIVSSHILSEIELMVDDIGIIANGTLGYQAAYDATQDLETIFMDVVRAAK